MIAVRSVSMFALAMACAAPGMAQLKAPPPPAPAAAGQSAGAAPAAPQVDPLTRDFRDCIQKAQAAMQASKADDPAAILACLIAEIKRQDTKLSGATQRLSKILPAESRKRLEIANTDWRRFRGSECNLVAEENSPPPGNLENANCRLRMTTIRALDIENSANMMARQEAALKAQQESPPAAAPAPAPQAK